jgi:hypothetical protein
VRAHSLLSLLHVVGTGELTMETRRFRARTSSRLRRQSGRGRLS